ncbi:MAG: hypothetical protein ABEJ58_06025 [Halodesulfurarchaeum sp.]
MATWKVVLYNPHLHDWRTKRVTAVDRSTAERRGMEEMSEGWEVDECDALCDFCLPFEDRSREADTRVVVHDPSEVAAFDPESEAQTRIAWVCPDHHDVVRGLDTV